MDAIMCSTEKRGAIDGMLTNFLVVMLEDAWSCIEIKSLAQSVLKHSVLLKSHFDIGFSCKLAAYFQINFS